MKIVCSMKIYFLVIPIIIGILFGVLILANQENLGTSSMALNKKNLLEGSTILGNPDADFETPGGSCKSKWEGYFKIHENSHLDFKIPRLILTPHTNVDFPIISPLHFEKSTKSRGGGRQSTFLMKN